MPQDYMKFTAHSQHFSVDELPFYFKVESVVYLFLEERYLFYPF
jgi:hypothetical protein